MTSELNDAPRPADPEVANRVFRRFGVDRWFETPRRACHNLALAEGALPGGLARCHADGMGWPVSPAELTTGWLTSVLAGRGPAPVEVQSLDVELLHGEKGITGQLARLRVRYRGDPPGLPVTLIAKFSAAEAGTRAMINTLGLYEREVQFYQVLSSATPVRQPHCYDAHLDPESGSALLLLEDITDARNGNSIAGCSVEQASQTLVALAGLHAAWWEAGDLASASWLRLRSLVAPEAMADAFAQGWPAFLQKLSIPVDSQIIDLGEWIAQVLPTATSQLFDVGPRTLVHNDVQADNLFFAEDAGEVVFIDWQMVTFARCVVDVAGWVRGHLEPAERRAVEDRLLRLYYDALVANGVHDYTLAACRSDYQLATVLAPARLACAVGFSNELQAHPGAFWDTLFPRYAA